MRGNLSINAAASVAIFPVYCDGKSDEAIFEVQGDVRACLEQAGSVLESRSIDLDSPEVMGERPHGFEVTVSPMEVELAEDYDKNYDEDEYQEALRQASFCFDPAEGPSYSPISEFTRGIVNFLAERYAKIEMPTGDRMDEVYRDLIAKHKEVWS